MPSATSQKTTTPSTSWFSFAALKSYDGLNDSYIHEFIDHAETYVRGQVHTNGLENFWSLLKRTLRGTYVSVDPKEKTPFQKFQALTKALTSVPRQEIKRPAPAKRPTKTRSR